MFVFFPFFAFSRYPYFTDSTRYFVGTWNVSHSDVVTGARRLFLARIAEIPNPSFKGSLSMSISELNSNVSHNFVLCAMKDGKLMFGETFANAKRFYMMPRTSGALGATGYFKPFHVEATFMPNGLATVVLIDKIENRFLQFEFVKNGPKYNLDWTEMKIACAVGAVLFTSQIFLIWNGKRMMLNQRAQAIKMQEARKTAEEEAEKDPTLGQFEK